MRNKNDQTESSGIIHQNAKLEKEFNLTTSSEIITKNNYLKNLYFIGFNSKPINKAIMNSINFTEAVSTIKSFLDTEDLTIKLSGSLVLGLCKIYEKKIKLYHDELENMLRINKDKKTLKAEKMQEDKFKNKNVNNNAVNINNNNDNNNFNANAENEKGKLKKSGKKANNNNNSSNNLENALGGNTNTDSNYDDMFLSTNLNLNTNSNSIRDFSLENNNTKRIFNLYDISELNSELSGSLTKMNLNSLERSQNEQQKFNLINTPSKLRNNNNLFDIASESSQSKLEFLRAKNSNLPSNAENFDTHSRFLNSANHLVNGLVDRSSIEDEMFNKNLNNYFLKIVSDEKLNFENIDNLYQADDIENFANDDYNNFNAAEEQKTNDLTLKNPNVGQKRLIFPELKNKLELDLEKADNEFESTLDADLIGKMKKTKAKGKNKKVNFEIDKQIYLKFDLPQKNKEDSKKVKRMKFGAEKNWQKVDYSLPEYLELKEKFQNDLFTEAAKEKAKQRIVTFNKDLSKSLNPFIELQSEAENYNKSKEDQHRSMIIKLKDSLFQSEHNTYEFLEFAKESISHDPADVFEGNENLEEKVDELFPEENNNNNNNNEVSFKDHAEEEENYKQENDLNHDFNYDENNDNLNNENFDNNNNDNNENSFSLNKQANKFKKSYEEAAEQEALKTEQKNSNIDKDILDCLKKNKKAKDNNSFKDVRSKLNHDAANVIYRMLCLAQREKIDIIQKELNDAEQTFVKLC